MPYKFHLVWEHAIYGSILCVSFKIQWRTDDANRVLWTRSIGIPHVTSWQKRPLIVTEDCSLKEIHNNLVYLLSMRSRPRACHTDQLSVLLEIMLARSLIREMAAHFILVAGSVRSAGLPHVKYLFIQIRFSGSVQKSKPARHFPPLRSITMKYCRPNARFPRHGQQA